MVRVAFIAAMLSCAFAVTASAQSGNAAAGEKDFVVCRACHQIGPGAKNLVGPSLNGVVGRKAGSVPGFQYSEANKNSGITWTPEELFTYLEAPQKVVPRTKMVFPGVKDAQKRHDIIAFLSQYNAEGQKTE